jgi:hypothetical protein
MRGAPFGTRAQLRRFAADGATAPPDDLKLSVEPGHASVKLGTFSYASSK